MAWFKVGDGFKTQDALVERYHRDRLLKVQNQGTSEGLGFRFEALKQASKMKMGAATREEQPRME